MGKVKLLFSIRLWIFLMRAMLMMYVRPKESVFVNFVAAGQWVLAGIS
jgi:hypothetical protein